MTVNNHVSEAKIVVHIFVFLIMVIYYFKKSKFNKKLRTEY